MAIVLSLGESKGNKTSLNHEILGWKEQDSHMSVIFRHRSWSFVALTIPTYKVVVKRWSCLTKASVILDGRRRCNNKCNKK